MTKTERIQQLERLVADLSYRLYTLEIERYKGPHYRPIFPSPYVYYGTTGATTRLGNVTQGSSSTGSVPPEKEGFSSRLGSGS